MIRAEVNRDSIDLRLKGEKIDVYAELCYMVKAFGEKMCESRNDVKVLGIVLTSSLNDGYESRGEDNDRA